MSRKNAMAALEGACARAEAKGRSAVAVLDGKPDGPHTAVWLDVADVRAILAKARFADRVNESRSTRGQAP